MLCYLAFAVLLVQAIARPLLEGSSPVCEFSLKTSEDSDVLVFHDDNIPHKLGGIVGHVHSQTKPSRQRFMLKGAELFDAVQRVRCFIDETSNILMCDQNAFPKRTSFSISSSGNFLEHDGNKEWSSMPSRRDAATSDIYLNRNTQIPFSRSIRLIIQSETPACLGGGHFRSQKMISLPFPHDMPQKSIQHLEDPVLSRSRKPAPRKIFLFAVGDLQGPLIGDRNSQLQVYPAEQCSSSFAIEHKDLKVLGAQEHCHLHPIYLELSCSSYDYGLPLKSNNFILAGNGSLLFDGNVDWYACPSWYSNQSFKIYRDNKSGSNCKKIQLQALDLKCKIPDLHSPLQLSLSAPMSSLQDMKVANSSPRMSVSGNFSIEATSSSIGAIHNSIGSSYEVESFPLRDRRFSLSQGVLTDEQSQQECFIGPVDLLFQCNTKERSKLTNQSTHFSVNEAGHLLHDGRAEWKACLNMVVLGLYDIFSERKTTKGICRIIQMRTNIAHRPSNIVHLNTIDPSLVVAVRANSIGNEAREVSSEVYRFKLVIAGNVLFNGRRIPGVYHLQGKLLIQDNPPVAFCFFNVNDFELDCIDANDRTEPHLREALNAMDFALADNGDLLHRGKRYWLLCHDGPNRVRIYSPEKPRYQWSGICYRFRMQAIAVGQLGSSTDQGNSSVQLSPHINAGSRGLSEHTTYTATGQ